MRVSLGTVLLLLPLVSTACRYDNPAADATPQKVTANETGAVAIAETPTALKVQLRELTDAEKKVLDEIEDFLKTYTGNGVYNYGSIDRFIVGVRQDVKGIHDFAEKMPKENAYQRLRRNAALAYPDTYFKGQVEDETEVTARGLMGEFLEKMGVDPKTAETPDDINDIKTLVTSDLLFQVDRNIHTLKRIIEEDQLPGTKVAFKGGITLSLVREIRERKSPVPYGAKLSSPPLLATP
jgi:hypothetical protein